MNSTESQDENQVDPRVKGELDALNQATDDVNKLENEISEERTKFKNLLTDATRQLTILGKKYGKSIERARPYYDVMKEVKQAKSALQRAINNFQKSNGIHRAAKETISLAEQRLSEFETQKVDMAWQEMLNIHTVKFMEAEKDRARSIKLHEQATKRFEFLSKKASKLKSKHKNSTAKTKRYFETKEKLELELQTQRHLVDGIYEKIRDAKRRYKNALDNLEKISLEIHEQRKDSRMMLAEREDGEGSEDPDENLVAMAKESQFDVIGLKAYDDITELETELDGFSLESDDSGEDYSSSEEGSVSSESSFQSIPSTPTEGPPNRMLAKRQVSNTSIEDHPLNVNGISRQRRSTKKRKQIRQKILKQESLPEEMSKDTIQRKIDVKKKTMSLERTYDTLHGTNNFVKSTTGRNDDSDYDIFDDLC